MTADGRGSITITVDGTLSGEGIEPVQTCCTQALSKGKPVRLHLRDVSAIDESGRTMLRHLAAEGVDLTANGIYSSYIVEEIQSAGLSKRRFPVTPPRNRQ
jgi:hypothetical protein